MTRTLIRLAFWTTIASGCTSAAPEDPVMAEKRADEKTLEAYNEADEKALMVENDAEEKALAVAHEANKKVAKIDAEAAQKVDEVYAQAEAVEAAENKRVDEAYKGDIASGLKDRLNAADRRLAAAEGKAKALPKVQRARAKKGIANVRRTYDAASTAVKEASALKPDAFASKRLEIEALFAKLDSEIATLKL